MIMIRTIFALILIPFVVSTSYARTLVFSEECNAPLNYSTDCNTNDGTKWCLRDNHWHDTLGHGSCNMAANVTVTEGLCVITLKKESVICEGTEKEWTGGEMNTLNRWGFTHGYLEARIKLPQGSGLWGALWTYPKTWSPNLPEHDILETPHGDNPSYMTYHYMYDGTRHMDQNAVNIPDFSDWHVWGFRWEPGLIIYTIDGSEYFRHEGDTVPAKDELMSIFASLSAGGSWMGEFPDATTPLPARMEIDYIRVYDQGSVQGEGGVVPSPPGQVKILK